MGYASVKHLWREGSRRLDDPEAWDTAQQRILHRVVNRIYEDLRRRLGSTFTVDELVALYEDGTEWAEHLAMEAAPEHPFAWESRTVVDGAFARYVREAADYAGGRRLTPGG